MKISLLLFFSAFIFSCNSGPKIVQNSNSSTQQPQRAEQLQDSRVHTTENQPPVPATGGKWTQSGDPIDTAKFDSAIASAEKAVKAKPSDAAAKKVAADAYLERGNALTQARQYASALGDYRRVLKYDPDNTEAKEWIDQIISIYGMLKKEAPKEGEEPPPLAFKSEKGKE
jgi:tetratricopeptide (TPR) repeat protein